MLHIPTWKPVKLPDGSIGTEQSSRSMFATCPCQIERMEREEAARKARERQDHIARIIRDAGTSPRLQAASFESWRHSPATEDAYTKAVQCAEDIAAGKTDCGLIILGSNGNGKSHLAESIGKRIAQSGKTYVFRSVPELLIDIRRTFDKDANAETDLMHTLTTCDLLVLDDLGAEKWSEWTEERLFVIVDARYRRQKNIVVTSNAPKMAGTDKEPGLRELAGPRIYDRLLEMCGWVVNGGESQRRRAQIERAR